MTEEKKEGFSYALEGASQENQAVSRCWRGSNHVKSSEGSMLHDAFVSQWMLFWIIG